MYSTPVISGVCDMVSIVISDTRVELPSMEWDEM